MPIHHWCKPLSLHGSLWLILFFTYITGESLGGEATSLSPKDRQANPGYLANYRCITQIHTVAEVGQTLGLNSPRNHVHLVHSFILKKGSWQLSWQLVNTFSIFFRIINKYCPIPQHQSQLQGTKNRFWVYQNDFCWFKNISINWMYPEDVLLRWSEGFQPHWIF